MSDSPPSGPAETLADAVEEFIAATGDMPDIHEHIVPLIDAWVAYNEAPNEATLHVIVPRPSGDEVEAVAEALHARFPTTDPLHLSSGVRWDELSETARRSYRGRAVGLISTLTAYREGQDG